MVDRARKRAVIFGAHGRMGRELISFLERGGERACELSLLRGLSRSDLLDDAEVIASLEEAEVVVDFSLPEATRALLSRLSQLRAPPALVCGVTGLTDSDLESLRSYSAHARVFYARNFSLGVALLTELSALSSRVLGPSFDVELFELHHRQKIDAPSGTARHLAEAVAQERAGELSTGDTVVPRDPALVHMSAGRGGQVIGDHTVYFLGADERLELTHRAQSRSLFAAGALRAARWLLSRPHDPHEGPLGMTQMVTELIQRSTQVSVGGSG